jgi:hypothetical protein
MSSISSIDTSIYSGIIEDLSSYTPSRTALDSKTPAVTREDSSTVDLSNYYSNIRPEDLLANAGDNVAKSAEDLDNAMVSAIENGYSVNDAVNIRLAKNAYQANCTVFNAINDMQKSTFELIV